MSEKKPGPLEGLSPADRLRRYSVLFRFNSPEEFDSNKLAEQWGVDQRGVASMMNHALRSKHLYEEMRRAGYEDSEFPAWWYSPARTETKATQQTELVPAETKQTEESEASTQQSEGGERLEEVLPKQGPPIGQVPARPVLDAGLGSPRVGSPVLDNTGHPSEGLGTPGTSDFTQAESKLLGSHGILRGQDGIWVHIVKEPSGRTIITPVNPMVELQRLSSQAQGDNILKHVNKNMIEQLEISTQAILKKVALNPTVFWLFQYVTSVKDKNTGLPLFVGDIGDFLSFAARFTGEAYYGVVPTYVTNRPSFLTTLHEQQQRATYPDQQLTYNQLHEQREGPQS